MKKYMISMGILCFMLLMVAACAVPPWKKINAPETTPPLSVPATSLLVKAEWLETHMHSTQIHIIDFGRKIEDYRTGHIPGAVFVARKTVWNQMEGIPGMLPSSETMENELEKAGIDSDRTIVIYGDAGGLWASRLFWALEYLGHPDVRLLEGGLRNWIQKDLPLQVAEPIMTKGDFVPQINPERLATKAWLLKNLNHVQVQLVDSRSPNEYIGQDVRAVHGGHIPGAANINWTHHLTKGEAKIFLPEAALAKIYASQDFSAEKTVVTYCQTGVRGTHAYFVLRLLGYPNVRVYDGSWAEWGNDGKTPKVSGWERFPN